VRKHSLSERIKSDLSTQKIAPAITNDITTSAATSREVPHFNFTSFCRCRQTLLRDEACYSLSYTRASRSPA
jgi:hypothetical protein